MEHTLSEVPLDPGRVLRLAVAIIEWRGALDHLLALQRVGVLNEQRRPANALTIVRRELEGWISQWPRVTSPSLTDAQVLEEARLYLQKHQAELMELLEGE